MTLADVTLNIWPMLLTWLVNIVVFFVVGYYFVKFLVVKLTPLVIKIKHQEEKKYIDE